MQALSQVGGEGDQGVPAPKYVLSPSVLIGEKVAIMSHLLLSLSPISILLLLLQKSAPATAVPVRDRY